MRNASIGVPSRYHLSVTLVSADWNRSTSRLKLQYHLNDMRRGTVSPWKYLILRVTFFKGKINSKYHKRIIINSSFAS